MGRRKIEPAPIPQFTPGSVYTFPIEIPGPAPRTRYGAVRVVAMGKEGAIVATLEGLHDAPPSLDDLRGRPALRKHRFSYRGEPSINWGARELPESFTRLGELEIPAEELARLKDHPQPYGGWDAGPSDLADEWRWAHDREAFLREVEERNAAWERQMKAEAEARKQARSFKSLRAKKWFASWSDYLTDDLVAACQKAVYDAIDGLTALPKDAGEDPKLAILKAYIERFNALDAEHGGFIETLEREAICDVFDQLAELAGLGDRRDLSGQWRDW